jgi:hypothetical protein
VFTGYAIGNGLLFLPLAWVLGLTALGAVVLRFSPEALSKGFVWRCGASLHHLLPIVELNKEFTNFLDDPRRERTEGWQLAYFAAHKLMGYLLAIFVGAAIAGLLKAE